MTREPTLATGARIGPYEIVDTLGAGAMGEVYRARDSRLDRDVAIKILPRRFAADAGRLRRFEEEARAAGQLNHPNILAVYDVGVHDGLPYIVAELLEGETLRSWIERGKPSVRKAIEWTHRIAEGLAAAHDKGIVHRDLKPANIFITSDGRLKILDFGLAKLTRPSDAPPTHDDPATETIPGTVLGTAGYMSPEQVRGQPTDHRTDLFSVGAILSEMLSGRPAFARATSADTMAAVLGEDPALPVDVPLAVRHIVLHCVEKDPAARFQSARDLAFDLESQRFASTTAPRRPAWLFPAIAAIAVAALAVWLSFGRRSAAGTAIGAAGRPAIAVMSFDNPSGAADIAWLTHGIPSMLVTGLAQTKGLDVISSSRLEEVVKAAGYGDVAHLDRARWRDVARRAGAGALVGGSVFKAAGDLRLDVSVEEVGSGRVVAAHSVHGSELFPLVDDVTARIVKGIGVDAGVDTHAIADMTTSSVEAFRLYSEALIARQNLRLADARERLERAVTLDPAFALAYLDLSTATTLLKDDAAASRYRALALQHLDRLPPRQQLLIQLTTSRTAGAARQAIVFGERLTRQFPDEAEGFHMLAHAYSDVNETALALKTWEAAIRGAPDAGNMHNEYGYELLQAGRYDEALGQLEEYRRLNPREPNPYDSLGEVLLMLGEPARAIEAFDTALTIDPQFFESYAGRAWAFSMQGRYDDALSQSGQFVSSAAMRNAPGTNGLLLRAWLLSRVGRYREAAAAAERGRAEAVRFSDIEGQIDADLLNAVVALERGRFEEARQAAARGLMLAPTLRDRLGGPARAALRFVAGVAEARAGALEAARARARSAGTDAGAGRVEQWWRHALDAEIALAGGSTVDAEAALGAAPRLKMWFSLGYGPLTTLVNTLPVHDTVARLRLARGDLQGAISAYQQLLTPSREQQWIGSLEPRFVLALARLLAKSGDAAAARVQYERFAALWHAADPHLPEREEAGRYSKH